MKLRVRQKEFKTDKVGIHYIKSEKSAKIYKKLKIVSIVLFVSICANAYFVYLLNT